MKKFFKGLSKKSKSSDGAGKSPSLSRQSFPGAISSSQVGYDVKEKDLGKLHKAAWNGDLVKVQQLARKDASPLDKENRTPLHLACSRGHHEVVTELLEWKAKTNIGDNESKTPLLRAVEKQNTACVQLLIDYQTGLDVTDLEGNSALHYAMRDGHADITAMLVRAGANVNVLNKEGQSALHIAVAEKHEEGVKLLLQKGADVDCLDKNQRSPLMLACYHGSINIVRFLLQHNADTTLKDIRGWSADDIAVMQAHHSCSQLITDHTVKLNIARKQQQSSNNSTPRSSSAPNTPRGQNTPSEVTVPLGVPALNVGDGDESDDDPTSRVSAPGEYDSWGDDTDVSLADDRKLKKPFLGTFVEDTEPEDINTGAIVNKTAVVKQDSNVSQISSEINWSPTQPRKLSHTSLDKNGSVLSEEDTWSPDASPSMQKKVPRVSFKRDDELSEVHDISMAESSENEAEHKIQLEDDTTPGTIVYKPSPSLYGFGTHDSDSEMKDIPKEKENILDLELAEANMMAELGISDAEDVSEADVSEGGAGDGDWNVSPQYQAPRHGILKNWKTDGDDNGYHDNNLAEQNVTANNKPLEQADWDSSEPIDDDENSASVQLMDRTFEDTDNLDLLLMSLNEERKHSSAQDDLDMIDLLKVDIDSDNEASETDKAPSMPQAAVMSNAIPQSLMNPQDNDEDDEDEDDWDSEDEIPSQNSDTPRNASPTQATPMRLSPSHVSPRHVSPSHVSSSYVSETHKSSMIQSATGFIGTMDDDDDDDDDDDEKTESISEWEVERVKSRMKKEEAEVAADLAKRGFPVPELGSRGNEDDEDIRNDEHKEMDAMLDAETSRQREWERQNREKMDSMVKEARDELRKEEMDSSMREDNIDGQEIQMSAVQSVVQEEVVSEGRFMETSTSFRGDDGDDKKSPGPSPPRREELSHIQTILGASPALHSTNSHTPKLSLPDLDRHDNKMGMMSDGNSFYDDDDSIMSDNFAQESPGIGRTDMMMAAPYLGDLGQSAKRYAQSVDDDGLSCTSTEDLIGPDFIMPPIRADYSQATLTSSDGGSTALKLQDQMREQKRQLEREKYQFALLQNKHRCLTKEKSEVDRKLESLSQTRSGLEQQKLEMDARIRSLEYNLTEESEKRRNAELLLVKTREQLERKEDQYTLEIEEKQRAELNLRNNNMEMRSASVTIKQLTEQKEELERILTHERNARQIQEEITHEQQKTQIKLQETSRHLNNERTDVIQRLESTEESRRQAEGSNDKYKAELYALKMELERLQARRSDEQTMAAVDTEALQTRIDDLKYEVKLNEAALSQATMQYNVQISQLRTENAMALSAVDKERATREKLEAEIESLKSRLSVASSELDKSQTTRTELERLIQKEKEEWNRYSERKEYEVKSLQDNSQSLQDRIIHSETRLMAVEKELHMANSSLIKATEQLNQLQREYDQKKIMLDNVYSNHAQEKEKNTKLILQGEANQERLRNMQHENVSVKQQLETTQRSLDDRNGAQIHTKLNAMMETIKADSNKSRSTLEEKNHVLTETVTRIHEELRNSENKRTTIEVDHKRLNDEHNDTVRRLAAAECTLKVTEEIREKLEKEKAKLHTEIEKVTEKYQVANEKNIELGARVTGMADVVGQHQAVSSSAFIANKNVPAYGELYSKLSAPQEDMSETLRRLEVENAKLDSELRYERQRGEMLEKDLDDSQKVRGGLEALCANLKVANQHLSGKLGDSSDVGGQAGGDQNDIRYLDDDEVMTKGHLAREAEASKGLWESEVISKNKLSQQIAVGKRKVEDIQGFMQEESHKLKRSMDAKKEMEDKLREAESQLQIEINKNQRLQGEVAELRTYLKLAMFRLNQCGITDLDEKIKSAFETDQKELSEKMEKESNLNRNKMSFGDEFSSYGPYFGSGLGQEISRQEIEKRYRQELNRKLSDVNRYLEEQASGHDRLYRTWCDREMSLKSEVKHVSSQLNDIKLKYEKALAERETSGLEASRYRDLYGDKIKRGFHLNDVHRSPQYRPRLTGSLSVPVSPLKLDNLKSNEKIREEILGAKLSAELNRSISKHLEAPPYDNLRPFVRSVDDNLKDLPDCDRSDTEYRSLLKRIYLI